MYIHIYVCADAIEKKLVDSQIKRSFRARPLCLNPPIRGARIVPIILNIPKLSNRWLYEVKGMANCIVDMRTLPWDKIKKLVYAYA